MRLNNFQLTIYRQERRLGALARKALSLARSEPNGYSIVSDQQVRLIAKVADELRGYMRSGDIEVPRLAFRSMYGIARMARRSFGRS